MIVRVRMSGNGWSGSSSVGLEAKIDPNSFALSQDDERR